MKKLLTLLVPFVALILSGCTSDEPIVPEANLPELTDNGFLPETVSDLGGEVPITFTVNTDWMIYSPNGLEVTPSKGPKGTNTVVITIPQNTNTEENRGYNFDIYTQNGEYISKFGILQDRAPLLSCESTIELSQDQVHAVVSIKANGQFTVAIPEEAKSWLSASVTADDSKWSYYNLTFTSSINETIEDRQAKVILELGSLTKELIVTQKGGAILTSTLTDTSNSQTYDGDTFHISPKGGKFVLSVSSNTEWTYIVDTDDNCTIKETAQNGFNKTFSVEMNELAKDAIWEQSRIDVNFSDGTKKQIVINQNDWSITVSVYKGEKLSSKIAAVQDKINEGYYISSLYIDNGELDRDAPITVTSVSISNVENIKEDFCSGCDKLRSLSLSNVQRIGARAFLNANLSSISIPATVTYIGSRAFGSSRMYIYVTCYNPTPPSLGSDVFHYGTGDGQLSVPMGSANKYKANSSWSKQFSEYREF